MSKIRTKLTAAFILALASINLTDPSSVKAEDRQPRRFNQLAVSDKTSGSWSYPETEKELPEGAYFGRKKTER